MYDVMATSLRSNDDERTTKLRRRYHLLAIKVPQKYNAMAMKVQPNGGDEII